MCPISWLYDNIDMFHLLIEDSNQDNNVRLMSSKNDFPSYSI